MPTPARTAPRPPESPTAGHADVQVLDRAFRRLLKIRHGRDNAKKRERELVTERKSLEEKLDDLGAGDTKAHLTTSRRLVVVLRSIDYFRGLIRMLADKADATIGRAEQGELFDTDEDIVWSDPSEQDLFCAKPPDPDQLTLDQAGGDEEDSDSGGQASSSKAAAEPKSKPRRRGVPDPAEVAAGFDKLDWDKAPWRKTLRHDTRDVSELVRLGIPDRIISKLRRAGLTEVRSLAHPVPDAAPGTFGTFAMVPGISAGEEESLRLACNQLAAEADEAQDAKLRLAK